MPGFRHKNAGSRKVGVETIGQDLLATAWTADGIVEGLEDPRSDQFALAVQWHPEIAWENDDFSRVIFERFVEAARTYAEAGRELSREVDPVS